MRQKKNKVAKRKVASNNELKHDSVKESNTTKKRIKQKSLGAIVAQRLKGTNQTQSSIVQNKLKSKPQVNLKHITQAQQKISKEPIKAQKSDTETNNSLSNKSNEVSDVPNISFTKITRENFGKTLLARKRKITDTNSKKTLSSIFSKQSESETKQVSLLDSLKQKQIEKDNVPEKKARKEFKEESGKSSSLPEKIDFNKKKKKKQLEKSKTDSNSAEDNNRNANISHKSVGKISSLFGHNPEIPNIGQRLVKPINEPIFTGTTFDDLKIHPFTVSIIHM